MNSLAEQRARGRCLGKLPVKIDRTTPTYRWLMDGAKDRLIPNNIDWGHNIAFWPVLGNDKLSDCTIAGALHQVQLWTANAGVEQIPDLDCAIAAYAHATGYDPATGANDNGAVELDILKYWMITGMPISDNGALDRLDGFAVIDAADIASISSAIYTFGTVYAGVELPVTADSEFEAGLPWADCTGAVGGLGGHMVPLIGLTPTGPLCVSWGRKQAMTWDWWRKYGVESYAVLSRDWIGVAGKSPSGMTMALLDSKITAIKGTLGVGAYSA